ncbi:3-deoxy-D-manno-octulosonic acid transferase [Oceanomicrobium pacificus]|uniref:3-deoxy-D-manno-octulosonic acid transferase n=1 Tax=Oceanomicrobium pacificus TaxID=2692916 RepID=A0A6B0U157_9RHOB|nr:3-deoxy-D-manno-octulosonic acid transferase [Oceanomicrobium pacificus]MXU64841.1 3-deoxy-D-manno-octulosonic acid transferase [Oceanomicrobium pacificus]
MPGPDPEDRGSVLLDLYLALSRRMTGVAGWQLKRRQARGKEDAARLPERLGRTEVPRPDGPLVWFHAASVGESLSILELLRRLLDSRPDLHALITTGTRSSAALLGPRLPDRCLHQFVPVDALPAVQSFLDHWKPDLAVWTESEFWPALMHETRARGIPMLLVNARLSARSRNRWRRLSGLSRHLLGGFDYVLAQDATTCSYLKELGVSEERIEVTGTLKEGSAPLGCDDDAFRLLSRALSGRRVWLAASTHAGEEEPVLAAHRIARRQYPNLLLVLAPRHPERGDEVAELIAGQGWNMARRSEGALPDMHTEVYLADTLGEMGLWFRLAAVSFIGGSLADIGGHNPFEPAALGSAILTGPHVDNFRDAFARFEEAGAALTVTDGATLGAALADTLQPEVAAAMASAAWDASSAGAAVTDRALKLLLDHLPEPV